MCKKNIHIYSTHASTCTQDNIINCLDFFSKTPTCYTLRHKHTCLLVVSIMAVAPFNLKEQFERVCSHVLWLCYVQHVTGAVASCTLSLCGLCLWIKGLHYLNQSDLSYSFRSPSTGTYFCVCCCLCVQMMIRQAEATPLSQITTGSGWVELLHVGWDAF